MFVVCGLMSSFDFSDNLILILRAEQYKHETAQRTRLPVVSSEQILHETKCLEEFCDKVKLSGQYAGKGWENELQSEDVCAARLE